MIGPKNTRGNVL